MQVMVIKEICCLCMSVVLSEVMVRNFCIPPEVEGGELLRLGGRGQGIESFPPLSQVSH